MSALLKPNPEEIITSSEKISGDKNARATESLKAAGIKMSALQNKPEVSNIMSVPANMNARSGDAIPDKVKNAEPKLKTALKDVTKSQETNVRPINQGQSKDGPERG